MNGAEFSRPCRIATVPPAGREIAVEATEAERAALAVRLDLPAVARLACRFRLYPERAGGLRAEARLEAMVEQVCVVTLEPFTAPIEEEFTLRFVPAGSEGDDVDPDAPDEIPYDDETIDLGETAAQQLALALDPYPRGPDADRIEPAPVTPQANPFAALAKLRRDH